MEATWTPGVRTVGSGSQGDGRTGRVDRRWCDTTKYPQVRRADRDTEETGIRTADTNEPGYANGAGDKGPSAAVTSPSGGRSDRKVDRSGCARRDTVPVARAPAPSRHSVAATSSFDEMRRELLRKLALVNVWRKEGQRAPHKPLLLLLALGRVLRKEPRLARYQDLETPLRELLKRFGRPRRAHHPEYPFGRLRKDGLWEIPEAGSLPATSSGDLHRNALVERAATGGFPEALHDLLLTYPRLVHEAVRSLLDGHFPRSLHDDVRAAAGIPHDWVADLPDHPATRDPAFRHRVLRAYERRCAVCGFDVRIADELLGLEAAHIQWRAAGGPDLVPNGLALCIVHHKALDRGALGLESAGGGFRVLVSSEVHGQSDALRWLRDFHHAPLRRPQPGESGPGAEYVEWHAREVFRNPPLGSPA